jgi:hypothetical protein
MKRRTNSVEPINERISGVQALSFTSHVRVMLALAAVALIAPAAASASQPTPVVGRLCAHQPRLHAACRTYGSVVSAARATYSERIGRDGKASASDSAAERSAEEALGTQYETEIGPAVDALNNAYAAAATAVVNSLTGATGPLCAGPLSVIPLVSKLACSTYTDALSAAQAGFRSATAPANASYAKQWAEIQSKYHALNAAVAADQRRAVDSLRATMARAAASFRRAAGP